MYKDIVQLCAWTCASHGSCAARWLRLALLVCVRAMLHCMQREDHAEFVLLGMVGGELLWAKVRLVPACSWSTYLQGTDFRDDS